MWSANVKYILLEYSIIEICPVVKRNQRQLKKEANEKGRESQPKTQAEFKT